MCWHRCDGLFWFRLWDDGPGFMVKDNRKHPPLFSERNGYVKFLRVGYWRFRLLKTHGN